MIYGIIALLGIGALMITVGFMVREIMEKCPNCGKPYLPGTDKFCCVCRRPLR